MQGENGPDKAAEWADFRAQRKHARTTATLELRRLVNMFAKNQSAVNFNGLQAQMMRLQDISQSEDVGELEAALSKDWEEGGDAPTDTFYVTRAELPVLAEGLRHLEKNCPVDNWSQSDIAWACLTSMRNRLRGMIQ